MIKLINFYCRIRTFLSLRLTRTSLRSLFMRKLRKRQLLQWKKPQLKNCKILKRILKKKSKMISWSLLLINPQSIPLRSPPPNNLPTPTPSPTNSHLSKHLKELDMQVVIGELIGINGRGWCLKLRNTSGSMLLVFMDLSMVSLEISLSATNMSSKTALMVSKYQRAQTW